MVGPQQIVRATHDTCNTHTGKAVQTAIHLQPVGTSRKAGYPETELPGQMEIQKMVDSK